jgi:fluoroquinolone transport system permease protein
MRMVNSIINDIKFQKKYGFYLVYLIITLSYVGILLFLPHSIRDVVKGIILFSDPAALGMFFMGAIILFEKSERVLDSIFVSPIKVDEYILAKVFSLSLISTAVGLVVVIATNFEAGNIVPLTIGLMLGSVFFSLIGLIVAVRVNSLNRFMIGIIPLGTIISIPPFLLFFDIKNLVLEIFPSVIIMNLILAGVGIVEIDYVYTVVLLGWIFIFWLWARRNVIKMIKSLGGI